MSEGTKTVTLGEMLGDALTTWLVSEHNAGRLTTKRLRTKLHEHDVELEKRGVLADYAYYVVLHVMNKLGAPIPED